jgi:ATP-dependent DNA helicase RecG
LLAQQMAQQLARARRAGQRAIPMQAGGRDLARRLLEALPFELTADQSRCAAEIVADLGRAQPMHRLLQGDVGSGKTVVAALAAAHAIDAGFQCALMAPTDILATQHLRKLADWLQPLGVGVAWLSGAQTRRERDAALAQAASGDAALIVGTHAVIQDKVSFSRLGLAIVDEQHRFGVAQRLSLRAKGAAEASGPGHAAAQPHLLMMSATPIPRTLAMALFGDLDVSTIEGLPPGRVPVRTRVFADDRRDAVMQRVRELVLSGSQAYWVCPLVEESAALELRDAEAACAELRALLGADAGLVGLLHGRMPGAQKAQVMADFAAARLRLLVATTVIEVGVDVPAASLMVIEHAERFGLSQLHQLRGRVGRGSGAAECLLLFSAPLSATARARLQALRDSSDGFVLAQRDLELRGPGELLGQRQAGLQMLRHADLQHDAALVPLARDAAQWLLEHDLEGARTHLERWLGAGIDWLAA